MRRLLERIITERYIDEPDAVDGQEREELSDDGVDEPAPPSVNTASEGRRAGDDDREPDTDVEDDGEDCRCPPPRRRTNR